MELSTPFVSVRSILSTIGLKDSTAYVVNGLLMLGTFFVCRVLMWPYVYYWYSGLVQMTVFQVSIIYRNVIRVVRNCKHPLRLPKVRCIRVGGKQININ